MIATTSEKDNSINSYDNADIQSSSSSAATKITTTTTAATAVFDTLDGKFVGRLREIVSNIRNTADCRATITFKTAKIEAIYSPDIIKKIESGRLIAIPNVMSVGTNDNFSIYEVAGMAKRI